MNKKAKEALAIQLYRVACSGGEDSWPQESARDRRWFRDMAHLITHRLRESGFVLKERKRAG